jgi:hypothetical protein
MNDPLHYDALAARIRAACLEAALSAYEDAKLRGLCHEGAWEVAMGAIRELDTAALLAEHPD